MQALYPSLRKHPLAVEEAGEEGLDSIGSTFLVDTSNSSFAGILESIRRMRVEDVNRLRVVGSLQDDLLCFLLDFFAGIRSGGICELLLEGVRIGGKEKVIGKVKEFL